PFSRHSAEIMRCPLTIAFTCASDVGATARDDWLRCLNSLVAVSERWKSIDFFIPITVLSRLLPAKGRLKSLEVLNLSSEPQNARSLPRAVDIFEDAPKLTRVTMSSHLSLDTFRLPWKQIIEYRIKLMEVWNCVEVLHHAPHLRALHAKLERARGNISGDTASPYSDHLDHKTFSYESLTSLSINGLMRPGYEHELFLRLLEVSSDSDNANVTQILFPSLTNFRLATSSGSLINFAALPLAGSCFGSLLTKVTIRSVFDALADYSGAKDFLLVCFHHNQDVVHILYEILSLPSSSDSGRPLVVLPKLEVLVLDIDYDNKDLLMPSWVIDPLKKMIRSRRKKDFVRRCIPLQKFHLYLASWETPRESFAKGLQDLTEEGFEIRVLRGLFAQV
ncbi:hypothetical protein F5890DRAFT_1548389, partial [Lentinula detonsa]